jgi:pimeloyl-ACP methyl ester carboxylesterase
MSGSTSFSSTATTPSIAYDLRGEGDAIIFLHGIGGGRKSWAAQVEALAHGFRTVAVDLRGYGDSDADTSEWQFVDFVTDVMSVLDELKIHRAHLVGLSMGGLVTQAVYALHPDRVASMTLAACRPASAPVEDGASFASSRLEHMAHPDPMASLADAMLSRLCGPDAASATREAIRSSMLALRLDNYVKVVRLRTALTPFLRLEHVAVPTLVLGGRLDPLAPVAQMTAIAETIPGSQLHIIENSGHFLNLEQPQEFNALVREFVANVQARDWNPGHRGSA